MKKIKIDKKKRKLFYEISFVIGMILLFLSFIFASKTLIGFIIPTSIFLFGGVIAFIIEKKAYNTVYSYGSSFIAFIHLTISCGSIVLFLFFLINYGLKTDKLETKEYDILACNSANGGKNQRDILHPDYTINYRNKNKVISFSKEYYKERHSYKKIQLTTAQGLFGFEILIEKKLIR